MNTPPDLPNDPAIEREWQRQELALRQERDAVDGADADAGVLRYRVLTRALRKPPMSAPPADFARQMARLAARQPRPIDQREARFEFGLMTVLLGLFAFACIMVGASYGHDWLQPLSERLPAKSAMAWQWLLALAACAAVSAVSGRRRPRRG